MAEVSVGQIEAAWDAGDLDSVAQIVEWLLALGVRVTL